MFGLGFAILAIDFIMRILIIEKKTAAKYKDSSEEEEAEEEPSDGHAPESEHQDTENGNEANEEDPLIQKEESQEYKIPPSQPKVIRSLPILYCLKNPRLLTALLLAFAQATLLATFDATVPTEAQQLFNFDSLSAGLLFIALVLPYLILGPLAGWTVDRYGPKPAAVIGFGYLVPVLILLRLARPGGTSQIIIYCALLALCGLGMGIIGSPSIVEASYVVSKYDSSNPDVYGPNGPYAQLYGINSMIFSAGLAVGPLISGALKDAVGYGNMNIAAAGLCLVTAILSFVYVGGKPAMLRRGKKRG